MTNKTKIKCTDNELLSEQTIRAVLSDKNKQRCPPIDIFNTLDSTNTYLLQYAKKNLCCARICLAEQQTAGHGRRARQWHTGISRHLALSCLWYFPNGVHTLAGLSLAIGLIVTHALQRFGAENIELKWPNDIMWQQKKLAGIGIEIGTDNARNCYAVIGIGLNIDLSSSDHDSIMQMQTALPSNVPVDLSTVVGQPCSRNEIAGFIIDALLTQLPLFADKGFSAFRQAWCENDMLYQQAVDVHTTDGIISGTMCGVDETGALQLATDAGIQCFYMGEVSVRKK